MTGVGSGIDSGTDSGAGGSAAGCGDDGWESSPPSSSSAVSFSFDTFPLRSFDRLFWNQTFCTNKEILKRQFNKKIFTWITRKLRPVSVANCSRWVLFGFEHESNALFKI